MIWLLRWVNVRLRPRWSNANDVLPRWIGICRSLKKENSFLNFGKDLAELVAVSVEGGVNGRFHAGIDRRGAAKVATTFFGNTLSQVAGPAAAMHRLPFG